MSKYKLPVRDSLVVGHINPDGDALSSIKAVLNYLRAQGKNAYAKVVGTVPDYLSWILSENDLPKKIPNVEQTIVLDCGPSEDRVGFKIEGPIVNIDHHITRIKEHNPRKKSYILDRCSVASALILDFGIVDEILLVGLYTDTLFMRSWNELLAAAGKIEIGDERAEQILTSIKPSRYMRALKGIQTAKFTQCRNGFLIAEVEDSDATVVSEIMDTLFRYSQNVCLVDGENRARLRTSNKALIESGRLAHLADILGGGGHNFAAGCDVSGKKTALFSVIKQLDVPEIPIEADGYEESKDKEKEEDK
jgi:phosphoesterase RecJ-like protein